MPISLRYLSILSVCNVTGAFPILRTEDRVADRSCFDVIYHRQKHLIPQFLRRSK